jgi:hypothetical protein
MKRFAFATLVAVAAVLAFEQQAKAWFNLGIGTSTNFNVSWGGHQRCGNHGSEPWPNSQGYPNYNWYGPPPCGPMGCGFGGGYGMPTGHPPGSGFVPPMPGSGSGSGSSGYYYNMPVQTPYAYWAPYYADGVQQAYYQVPGYYYGW